MTLYRRQTGANVALIGNNQGNQILMGGSSDGTLEAGTGVNEGIPPIADAGDLAVLDRIDVAILDVAAEIVIISDQVLLQILARPLNHLYPTSRFH